VLRQQPSAEQRRDICRTGIKSAIEQSRFTLYAQPLRDLELNRTTRHEILLRVLDDAGRPAPPSTFLHLAEHVDEIIAAPAGPHPHRRRTVRRRPGTPDDRDHRDRRDRQPDRGAPVRRRGSRPGLPDRPRRLRNRQHPVGFLTKLPVDLVKIDGSFIDGLPASQPLQAALLREYGVDFAQGFHVGRPESFVAARRVRPALPESGSAVTGRTGPVGRATPGAACC
jgi:hypothetical protein